MIEINSAEVEMLVETITGDLFCSIHDGTYPAETYWMFKADVAMVDAWFAKIYKFSMVQQIP
ncbi:hypothetical protein ACLBQR_30605, partial [Klebsiella pneumoniae]